MTTRGAAPLDPETAARILARVPYASRFPIGCLVPPVGLLQSSVRSLGELELALRPESRSLVGVHLERLVTWIDSAIGDAAGAAAVREATLAAPCYADACQAAYFVIRERVANARHALGLAPAAEDSEPDPR
jgi:hypothetical protein